MSEPVWLSRDLVLAIQAELIAQFGGAVGIRDEGLLESALARPQNLFAYGEPSLTDLAAAYAYGLTRNHPFLDGNKRIALSALDVFLQLNGMELIAPEAEAVVVMRDLAAGELDEPDFATWIKINAAAL